MTSAHKVDPAVQGFLDAMAANPAPPAAEQGVEAVRAGYEALSQMAGPSPEMKTVENSAFAGPAGPVPIRIYTPNGVEAPAPVLVWFHGGGWVIGSLDTCDAQCRQIAERAGVVVVSVGYRLAPEHVFPAAFDDAVAALEWVAANAATFGGDPTKIAVGGASAGGNLAAAVALRARDNAGPELSLQLLVYPVTLVGEEYPSRISNGTGYLLTKDTMDWFIATYVPDLTPALGNDPRLSPIHADDLHGACRAHVVTAYWDPLRDEGEAYAHKLRAAGVRCSVTRYEGLVHEFFGHEALFPIGKRAVDEACIELRKAFGLATGG
jgi:acetyl esterase